MSLHLIKSAANASKYFEADGGYYVNDRTEDGTVRDSKWFGVMSDRAGIEGQAVKAHDFSLALNGVAPGSDPNRPVGSRGGRGGAESRKPGWDFNISAPKSVSLAALFDERVTEAFQAANDAACRVIERAAACRVTIDGDTKTRVTGELLIAQFTHWNTRSNDVSLHVHNVVANMTTGPDGKPRAVESKGMHEAQRAARTTFYAELGSRLERLGYSLRWEVTKGGRHRYPEISSVSRDQIRAFSTRNRQIHAAKQKLAAARPGLSDRYLEKLAYYDDRKAKQHLDLVEQKEEWRQRARDAGIELEMRTTVQKQMQVGLEAVKKHTNIAEHAGQLGATARRAAEGAISYAHFTLGKPATPRMIFAVHKVAADRKLQLPETYRDLGVAREFLNRHSRRELPTIAAPVEGMQLHPRAEALAAAESKADQAEQAERPSPLLGGQGLQASPEDLAKAIDDLKLSNVLQDPPGASSPPVSPNEPQYEQAGPSNPPVPRNGPEGLDQTAWAAFQVVVHDGLTTAQRQGFEEAGVSGMRANVSALNSIPATEARLVELCKIEADASLGPKQRQFTPRQHREAKFERQKLESFMSRHAGRLVEVDGKLHAVDSVRSLSGRTETARLTSVDGRTSTPVLLMHDGKVAGAASSVNSGPYAELAQSLRELGVAQLKDTAGQVNQLPETTARLKQLDDVIANKPGEDGAKPYLSEEVDRARVEKMAIEAFKRNYVGRLVEVDGKLHALGDSKSLGGGFTSSALTAWRPDGQKSAGHLISRDGMSVGVAGRVDPVAGAQRGMERLVGVERGRHESLVITRLDGTRLTGRIGETTRVGQTQISVLRDGQSDRVLGTVMMTRKGDMTSAHFIAGQRLVRDPKVKAWERAAERRARDERRTYVMRGLKMYKKTWFGLGQMKRVGAAEMAGVLAVRAAKGLTKAAVVATWAVARTLVHWAADKAAARMGVHGDRAWRLNAPLSQLRQEILESRGLSKEAIKVSLLQDKLLKEQMPPAQYRLYLEEKYAGGGRDERIEGALARLDERSAWRNAADKMLDEVVKDYFAAKVTEQEKEVGQKRSEEMDPVNERGPDQSGDQREVGEKSGNDRQPESREAGGQERQGKEEGRDQRDSVEKPRDDRQPETHGHAPDREERHAQPGGREQRESDVQPRGGSQTEEQPRGEDQAQPQVREQRETESQPRDGGQAEPGGWDQRQTEGRDDRQPQEQPQTFGPDSRDSDGQQPNGREAAAPARDKREAGEPPRNYAQTQARDQRQVQSEQRDGQDSESRQQDGRKAEGPARELRLTGESPRDDSRAQPHSRDQRDTQAHPRDDRQGEPRVSDGRRSQDESLEARAVDSKGQESRQVEPSGNDGRQPQVQQRDGRDTHARQLEGHDGHDQGREQREAAEQPRGQQQRPQERDQRSAGVESRDGRRAQPESLERIDSGQKAKEQQDEAKPFERREAVDQPRETSSTEGHPRPQRSDSRTDVDDRQNSEKPAEDRQHRQADDGRPIPPRVREQVAGGDLAREEGKARGASGDGRQVEPQPELQKHGDGQSKGPERELSQDRGVQDGDRKQGSKSGPDARSKVSDQHQIRQPEPKALEQRDGDVSQRDRDGQQEQADTKPPQPAKEGERQPERQQVSQPAGVAGQSRTGEGQQKETEAGRSTVIAAARAAMQRQYQALQQQLAGRGQRLNLGKAGQQLRDKAREAIRPTKAAPQKQQAAKQAPTKHHEPQKGSGGRDR